MVITDEAALKTVKTYLPYVCIIALAWMNYQQFGINQKVYERALKEANEKEFFWRDAFMRTKSAINETRSRADTTINYPGSPPG